MERDEQLNVVARRALDASRTRLMMAYRFFDRALWQMPFEPAEKPETEELREIAETASELGVGRAAIPLATDGMTLVFGAHQVLMTYRKNPDAVVRALLHSVLHCIFRHPFHTVRAEPALWSLACDICIEATALQLCAGRFAAPEDAQVAELARKLEEDGCALTPARVYRALLLARKAPADHPLLAPFAADPERMGAPFARDDHGLWDLILARPSSPEGDDASEDGNKDKQPGDGDTAPEGTGDELNPDAMPARTAAMEGSSDEVSDDAVTAREDWLNIARQMQAEMQVFARRQGDGAGRLARNLELANRSTIDYEGFLRRFCTRAEEVKTNDDEFDYIFYTYGLSTYGNMPLIEPLEYQETETLREFVIAIDTSGSCSATLVRIFLTRTCEILGQARLTGQGTRIHIVQADAVVQRDTLITCEEDLRAFVRDLEMVGGGGTDFRPAFAYVDRLRKQGDLVNLRGMVYFTDGFGIFPRELPDYDVAFVFVEDDGRRRQVPPWAMKVVMGQYEIEQLGAAGH